MGSFPDQITDLIRRTAQNTTWRQRDCFNLIPSETTPSLLVKLCEIADPAGRYAEHRTFKGREIYYYQGTGFIYEVEEEARREICKFFECTTAELRPISGQMANEVVFRAMLKYLNKQDTGTKGLRRMRLVLNNDLTKGGHLSAQPMGALFNYVHVDEETGHESVVHLPQREDHAYECDVEKLEGLIATQRPEFVILGKSMFLYPEPVEAVRKMVEQLSARPVIHYDMAHVLGLYGAFQSPLAEGADIVTGSTHKTFFGPQRGVIVSNMSKDTPLRPLWLAIKNRAFPGSTSNHHLGSLLGLCMATYEMNAFKIPYQKAVLDNAKAFARALDQAGIDVEGRREDGFTFTHQVVIRVSQYGTGEEIAERLEKNNLLTNYQALPDDQSFAGTSGIRLGVQEMTRFGMVGQDFENLAQLMADVIVRDQNVKEKVTEARKQFLEMQYCLPASEALPLATQLMGSLLPHRDDIKLFAETLNQCAHLTDH